LKIKRVSRAVASEGVVDIGGVWLKKRKIMDEMRELSTIVRNIQAIMRVSP
jgi:hypothetical protein